jgi:carbonic anhydrase/acetyltransferase-like protein (isoleucine patch superfamily)
MLHGCTIGDESLIGIAAIVLNGVALEKIVWWALAQW